MRRALLPDRARRQHGLAVQNVFEGATDRYEDVADGSAMRAEID